MRRRFFLLIFALCALLSADQAFGAEPVDSVSSIIQAFHDKASSWEPVLKGYALKIFYYLLIFEVCFMGIKAALNRDQVADILKQFVLLILVAGFFLAVINHYEEWSWNLINGLKQVGLELGGEYSADTPFLTGMRLVNLILGKMSISNPIDSLGLIICGIFVVICFALIAGVVVLIKCEAVVTMYAALILVGLGAAGIMRDFAVNALRYVFSIAMKLFVMQLVLGIGVTFIESFDMAEASFQDIFTVIGASIILLLLTKSLPEVCAGIISGSHVSGGGMGAAGAFMGAAAVGAGVVGVGAAGVKNTVDAVRLGSMTGRAPAEFLWNAHKASKGGDMPFRDYMKDQLAQAKVNVPAKTPDPTVP
jgi:type IV secretion system protein TrbL